MVGGVYSHISNKLNKPNALSAKISSEFKNSGLSYPSLIHLGHLEIHIALSNPNIDVRILVHDYCAAIVSLFELDIE